MKSRKSSANVLGHSHTHSQSWPNDNPPIVERVTHPWKRDAIMSLLGITSIVLSAITLSTMVNITQDLKSFVSGIEETLPAIEKSLNDLDIQSKVEEIYKIVKGLCDVPLLSGIC